MINITDQTARQNYLAEMTAIMKRLENIQAKELKPVLNRQFMNAAKSVASGMMAIDYEVDRERARLIKLFQKHYKRVATVFSKKVFDFVDNQKGVLPSEIKTPLDEFWRGLNSWIMTQSTNKITSINRSSKRGMRKILSQGMGEGLSHKAIAKNIREAGKVSTPWKALRIARTETHTAGVKAVDSAIASSRIQMEREWVSARDNRTRTRGRKSRFEHLLDFPVGANKERVAQDGMFKGTGESLKFPGDPSGSPGNTVNCRCVVLYHTVRSTQPVKPYVPPVSGGGVLATSTPEESWSPAKTLPELNRNGKNLKIGRAKYDIWEGDKAFTRAEKLALVNGVHGHWAEMLRKFPGLKERAFVNSKKMKFMAFENRNYIRNYDWVAKKEKPSGIMGQWAQYPSSLLRIAAKRSKKHRLNLGLYHNVSDDFYSVFRHEIGHYIQDDKLVLRVRHEWERIWQDMGKKNFMDKISTYSATNVDEAFAECFSAYTSPLYKRGMLPRPIERFMDDVLKPKALTKKKKLPGKSPKSKPMNSIGKMSDCLISGKGAFPSELKRPQACRDYVRQNGKWMFQGRQVPVDVAERLDKMKLPPSWREVVVSTDSTAKIQAMGLDKAGRWQYRYSAEHIKEAAKRKFDRVKLFKNDMTDIRKRIGDGMAAGDDRAFLLQLENKTAIRAGSTKDFRAKKKAYGLTTLQHEHLTVKGNRIKLNFTAKEGIRANYELTDPKLARWLEKRKGLTRPGEKLFPDIPAKRLNAYIKEVSGGKNYSIKDFRTYHGTRIAHDELKKYAGTAIDAKAKKEIVKKVSEKVSKFLSNTPTMAKKSYIDPVVWDFIGGL
jgi:DNA topoisomerase-1